MQLKSVISHKIQKSQSCDTAAWSFIGRDNPETYVTGVCQA
jgi:hypothetical protein